MKLKNIFPLQLFSMITVVHNITLIMTMVVICFRTDALKIGVLKGTDEFGNRYYQNKNFFIGKLNI